MRPNVITRGERPVTPCQCRRGDFALMPEVGGSNPPGHETRRSTGQIAGISFHPRPLLRAAVSDRNVELVVGIVIVVLTFAALAWSLAQDLQQMGGVR